MSEQDDARLLKAPPTIETIDVGALAARVWPFVVLVGILTLALHDYAGRSARVVTTDDPAELQVIARGGGIPHGTSYPLYVWLLRAFVALPFGPFAFRCNLFSAVCGVLALAAIAWATSTIDARGGVKRWIAGLAAAAMLAPSYTFTSVSIFTGMYTLHLLLAFVVIGYVARWARTGRARDIEIALGTLGAMTGNHILTLALVPGVLVVVVWRLARDRSAWRGVVRGIGWGVAGVVVCSVGLFVLVWLTRQTYDHWAIILSAPKFFEIDPEKARSVWYAWWYEATCRQFRYEITSASWEQRVSQLRLVIPGVAAELSPSALVLAAMGFVRVVRQSPRVAAFLVVVVATHVWLASGYTATIKTHIYLLPVVGIVAILAGVGVWAVVRLPVRLARGRAALAVAGGAVVVVASIGAHLAPRTWLASAGAGEPWHDAVAARLKPRPDEHNEKSAILYASRLSTALPARAIVFADWSRMFALHYVLRFERGIDGVLIYDPYPYGRPHREFPVDYQELIESKTRDVRVFYVPGSAPPPFPGFHAVRRAPDLYEIVRDGDT